MITTANTESKKKTEVASRSAVYWVASTESHLLIAYDVNQLITSDVRKSMAILSFTVTLLSHLFVAF